MKRPAATTSDSMSSLMSICQTSDQEQSPRINGVYGAELQSMLDGFDEDECGHVSEKKRRLSVEQVKALEKNFEVENKLEPERKVNLARELGLQPRQVAVWFQNRRARWKTKQLERDYGVLKTNYDNLKLTFQTLQQDNQALLQEIRELKTKLQEDNSESNVSVEEEIVAAVEQMNHEINDQFSVLPAMESDFKNNGGEREEAPAGEGSLFADFKDGSSDSDSSAVLNEDYSPTVRIASPGVVQNHHFVTAAAGSPSAGVKPNYLQYGKGCQFQQQTQMFPKMEEHNFFSEDEACNFFSDEQAPTLHWWS